LWPRSRWDQAEERCFAEGLVPLRLNADEASAIVREHKRQCGYGTPSMARLTRELRDRSAANWRASQARNVAGEGKRPDEPPGVTGMMLEIYERIRRDPEAAESWRRRL